MALAQAMEVIEEIGLGTATDIMTAVDRYGASLEISRSNEGALDLAMQEVDDYNSRFTKKSIKTDTASSEEPIGG